MAEKYSSNRGGNHIKAQYRRNLRKKTKEELQQHGRDIWWGKLILFVIIIFVGFIIIALGGEINP